MAISWCNSNWHTNEFLVDDYSVLSATYKKTFEDMEELRKEQHRVNMVEFRINKKHKRKSMQRELQQLEREMKVLAARVRNSAVPTRVGERNTADAKMDELRELIVEREALQGQNLALCKEIEKYVKFQKAVLEASDILVEKEERVLPSNDGTDTPIPLLPLIRDEFDARMDRFEADIASNTSFMWMVGSFMGWKVLRAPLSPFPLGTKRLIVRTQTSKRLCCSFDLQQNTLCIKQKDLSPMALTPEAWGHHKTAKVSTQVFQEFDEGSILFIHNIPGLEKDSQCLFQVRRCQRTLEDGRRMLTASMLITDSYACTQNDGAETQDNAKRITKGGKQVSITEIDENSVDVCCDQWTSCEDKMHVEHLTTDLVQFSLWWEQLTVPSSLLLRTILPIKIYC